MVHEKKTLSSEVFRVLILKTTAITFQHNLSTKFNILFDKQDVKSYTLQ